MNLEHLAGTRFSNLTQAEKRLLRSAPLGEMAVCGPSDDDGDLQNQPEYALEWSPDRVIRAEVIRWLFIDSDARALVDPKGILIYGAKISGVLDLSNISATLGLSVWHSRLTDCFVMFGLGIPELDLQGTWVSALYGDRAKIQGRVFLRNGFRALGEVRFSGAQIGGDLDCTNGRFSNPRMLGDGGGGVALNADGAELRGDVLLCSGFCAEGEVRLIGARIGGDIDCRSGCFSCGEPKAAADGNAFSADRVVVRGSVFLADEFKAWGTVRLWGAQIGGKLDCNGAVFEGTFSARRAEVKGDFCWTKVRSEGNIRLDLLSVKVCSFADDVGSWPTHGNLYLDGFVYERISSGPKDARTRLDWIGRDPGFAPHPYRQLARVLRSEGDESGARLVLFRMECRRRVHEDNNWLTRCWSYILRIAVGYGYYPGRALLCLCALAVAGVIVFECGFATGSIVPTDGDAYKVFKHDSQLPLQYERFNPLIYSLENAFPVVKLGQTERWQSDPSEHWQCSPAPHVPAALCQAFSPISMRWFRWVQVCLGWFFTTTGAAAVTGIVRKD